MYVAAVLATAAAHANGAADAAGEAPEAGEINEVVVTGTRTSNLLAVDSPSPIQILSPEALKAASGNPDLMSTLAQIVPSLTVEAFGADMAGQTLLARLRGLSPNHVLVLIDGKRRHTTSNLAVDGGSPYQGGAGVDLNFIPVDAIDHIEVLTDGAAAQYGSDALAGVINIILKKDSSGGDVQTTYGKFFNGGGVTDSVDGHIGLEPYTGGYFNLTGADHNHGHTDVGGPDPRAIGPGAITGTYPNSNMLQLPGYPYLNHILGDAETHVKLAMFNTGLPISSGTELYAFGSYGTKDANSYENYRQPERIKYTNPETGVTTYPFPFGFNPREATQETDYQLTGGLKGSALGFSWDISSSYGVDDVKLFTLNSVSNTYRVNGLPTLSDFYDGKLKATQWTTNLDLSRDLDVGLAGPVNVALGGEYRRETYLIAAGIPGSYLSGGAQSYAGFAPVDAGINARKVYAGYIDFAGKLFEQLRFDAAARYEHYSDFGNTTAGKLSLKYDLSQQLAVRATASNGFRAPTLAEEYYTSTNVGPSTAQVQLPPNSAAGKLLGIGNGLQPEKSLNFSAGIVWHPLPRVMATLDVYQITITNRITGSGAIVGLSGGQPQPNAALVNEVITATGQQLDPAVLASGTTSVAVFSNGIDTRTRGADLTFKIPQDLSFGHIDWLIAGTYAQTRLANTPPGLPAAAPGTQLYDQTALADVTTASPQYVVDLGFTWTLDKLTVNFLEKLYGPSWDYGNDDGDIDPSGAFSYFRDQIPFTPITNLDVGYQFTKNVRLNIGALNLFNRFPPTANPIILNAEFNVGDYSSVAGRYPSFAPYGIDGGFYYAKATLSF
jgi:iron complex outermembrane receptor protein